MGCIYIMYYFIASFSLIEALKDAKFFCKGRHTLGLGPSSIMKPLRVSGVTVLSLVEAVIRFSDILSCLFGSINRLLEANRGMNGTDLHPSCLCVVVILAEIVLIISSPSSSLI